MIALVLNMLQSSALTMGDAKPTKLAKATEDTITGALLDQTQRSPSQSSSVEYGFNCANEDTPSHATAFVSAASATRAGRRAERLAFGLYVVLFSSHMHE
jgi:hypothetical protein